MATDLAEEQRKIHRGVAAAFLLCASVLISAYLFLPNVVEFPEPDLQSRLVFWACANLIAVMWVMIGVGMVSTGRKKSAADIRGSAYSPASPKIAVAVAFLQNTLEQASSRFLRNLPWLCFPRTVRCR
ncbi:hypothetical protein GOC18_24405 [Sinorhizobium meliloti]|nr:hypothetical protein [Sinorhizobium meliloti]